LSKQFATLPMMVVVPPTADYQHQRTRLLFVECKSPSLNKNAAQLRSMFVRNFFIYKELGVAGLAPPRPYGCDRVTCPLEINRSPLKSEA
jgi:hypothetical protein